MVKNRGIGWEHLHGVIRKAIETRGSFSERVAERLICLGIRRHKKRR